MNTKLNKRWVELEKEKSRFIKELKKASNRQLHFSPDEKSWNMLQVMAHLVAVERTSFGYLSGKKYSHASRPKGKLQFFRALFLRIMLASPIRFKAPPIAALQPPEKNDLEELIKEWSLEGKKTETYLENFPEEKLDELIFRHPVIGWLTIGQTINFLIEHIQHHRLQIRRIEKSPSFPSSNI